MVVPFEMTKQMLCSLSLGVGAVVSCLFIRVPKYIIYTYFRLLTVGAGMTRKVLKVSDNFTVSYIERGRPGVSGPSVLFVHGFSSNKESFCQTLFYLPNRYHVISVDIFGHGETSLNEDEEYSIDTYVKYVKMFVDAVGLSNQKFHIVGNSLGAHISGIYATLHPTDLLSITMFCPHGIHYEKEDVMREEAEKTGKFVFLPQNNSEFRTMVKFLWYSDLYLPEVVVTGAQQLRTERNEFYTKALKSLYEPHSIHLLEKNLHKLHTPSLVIWGREDQCVSVECVETLKEKLPTRPQKIVILDKVGHAVQFEAPKKCADTLDEFFQSFA